MAGKSSQQITVDHLQILMRNAQYLLDVCFDIVESMDPEQAIEVKTLFVDIGALPAGRKRTCPPGD